VIDKRYTYDPPEDGENAIHEDDLDYPALDDDEVVDRFIEERRIQFRAEWFRYVEENGICD